MVYMKAIKRNGQLQEKSNYKDGELDGLYESYYENGQLSVLKSNLLGMKIRNPFKDYLCRFKDDATKTEKTVWTLVLIYFGYALGHVLVYYIF